MPGIDEELQTDRLFPAEGGLDRGRLGPGYQGPAVLFCREELRGVMGQLHNESIPMVRNMGSVGFRILPGDCRIWVQRQRRLHSVLSSVSVVGLSGRVRQ